MLAQSTITRIDTFKRNFIAYGITHDSKDIMITLPLNVKYYEMFYQEAVSSDALPFTSTIDATLWIDKDEYKTGLNFIFDYEEILKLFKKIISRKKD